MTRTLERWLISIACVFAVNGALISAQSASKSPKDDASELKFVVYLSRHGVRSPTALPAQYNVYSTSPWPDWDVPPGHLTPHGYDLIKQFGEFDRMELAKQGLLSQRGCEEASEVTFYADSDQRTRETGKAIAEGIFPGCHSDVQFLPEGTNDPLFHFLPAAAELGTNTRAQVTAAIARRIGGNPANLTERYRRPLAELDSILAKCGSPASTSKKRISLFDIPATLAPGSGDHLAELRGPLNTASTLMENILLEYAEGMDASRVGWGCVDGTNLRSLMELHTAATDLTERTPEIAKIQASNLLAHIKLALEQAVVQKQLPGAPGKPGDRALFLIGHDTNQSNVAGLLNMTWDIDRRRDDTPPGGALIFELWQNPKTKEFSVRTYFTVQTLEQMRSASGLTLTHPPERVPVVLPACANEGSSCSWSAFAHAVDRAIDTRYINVNK